MINKIIYCKRFKKWNVFVYEFKQHLFSRKLLGDCYWTLKQLYHPIVLARDWIKKVKNSIFVSWWIIQTKTFILVSHWYIRGILRTYSSICDKAFYLKLLTTFSKASSQMFDQTLNTSVFLAVTFVLILLCTLFLVWCNHSIDAARLPPPRRVTIDECNQ